MPMAKLVNRRLTEDEAQNRRLTAAAQAFIQRIRDRQQEQERASEPVLPWFGGDYMRERLRIHELRGAGPMPLTHQLSWAQR